MKKNDFVLIGLVLLTAIAVMSYQYLKKDPGNQSIQITVDGQNYGTYNLEENQTIDINGTNTLEIQDGEADMSHAECPDKLCVNQKAISRDGESIICLPNKVVVTVEGGEARELDGVTH